MGPVLAKLLALILLGAISLVLGLLPVKVASLIKGRSNSKWPDLIISYLLCFGAGVLMSTSFVHMLPETRNMLSKAYEYAEREEPSVPIAEVVFIAGFLLVYVIEEITEYMSLRRAFKNGNSLPKSSSPERASSEVKVQSVADKVANLMIIVALSIHAVLEGLAIGLQEHAPDVWVLFTGVATHKFVIAFCVGMELVNSGAPMKRFLVYMITLAITSPIGIGIGMTMAELMPEETWARQATLGILQGIAGGALVYVTFFEIIAREKAKKDERQFSPQEQPQKPKPYGIHRFLSVIVGFAVMLIINMVMMDGHEH